MRRTLLRSLALAGVVLGGLGHGAAAADKLVVVSWGGLWGEAFVKAFIEPFEQATGIDVELQEQANQMDMLAKFRSQKEGEIGVDLWLGSPATIKLANESGLLAPIPAASVPNSAMVPERLVTEVSMPVFTIFYGILYNADTVPFEIKNWNDIFDPRLASALVVPAPTGYSGKFLITLAWLNGGDESNIDPGFEAAKRLLPNIAIIQNSETDAIKLLTTGEVDAAPMVSASAYTVAAKSGGNYRFVAPDPYVPGNPGSVMMLKGTQNRDNALRFIDFMLSREAQESFNGTLNLLPVNKDAAPPAELAAFAPSLDKIRFPNEAIVGEHLAEWTDRWQREIVAK